VLDRIIFITASPNQLHIFDPMTSSDTTVTLPKPPLSLSVSLDGLHAAVGHDALISYVNLQTASLQSTLPASETVTSLVLGDNYVYILGNQSGTIAMPLSGGTGIPYGAYAGATGRLHPSGTALYATFSGSPGLLLDFDISTGPATAVSTGPYWGDYPVCGGVWFSPDGGHVYTGCGTVYQSSPQTAGGWPPGFSGPLNTRLDGLYWTQLPGTSSIRSLNESASLGRVAAIPGTYQSLPEVQDNQVLLYDSTWLEPAATFQLPDFTLNGNSFQAHGQQVFYNSASTALYVVMQADGSSGLLHPFAVQIFPVSNPSDCNPGFVAASATAPPTGSSSVVGITAPASCIYQATSNAAWVQIISGAYGSGTGSLTYVTRPNTGAARSATITLGSQAFTVTQAAASTASGSLKQVGYSVTAADYSKALDRVILIVSHPNELHIYDPVSGFDQIVALPKSPLCLSVSPDGLTAAVGYLGWVSTVNLSTGVIGSTTQVFTDVHSILLAGNGYFYAYPQNTWGYLFSVQIATGSIVGANAIYNGRYPKLYADGTTFYTESSKWDITTGPATILSQNLSVGCAPFWLTEDGARMITSCGRAYTTSPVPALDLQYNGSFANASYIQWAAEAASTHSTALIPSAGYQSAGNIDTYLQLYGDEYLSYNGGTSLPPFMVGSTAYAGHGRYVFWNSAEDKLIVLEQADSTANLTADYGVFVYPLTSLGAGCSFALGASSAGVAATGGLNTVGVTTAAGCAWEAVSNSSWITVSSGGVGFGPNSVLYSVTANAGSAGRSGTLTIAGQTFTIVQAGSSSAGTATHFSVMPPASATAGSPLSFTVTALDANNQIVGGYSDPVQFTSTDGAATLPSDAILNGTGTFSASLVTAGAQTITVSDSLKPSVTGTSATITISPPSGLRYVAVSPCRVVDTRHAAGPFGAPFVPASGSRSFSIPNSTDCNIPSTAQAYSLNLTVVPHGTLGYITMWPTGANQPVVSTLNSIDGRVKANAAIVPAGNGGAVSVFATNDTDVVLDINGYFVATSDSSADAFYPTTPCRLVDTRAGASSTVSSGALAGGTSRTLPLLSSNCAVPATATAYSLNFTVVPAAGTLGYLTVYPTGVAQPVVSTLNAPTGTIVANAAIIPAGTAGSIDVFATDTTDLIVDINGYFAPPGSGGLSFYSLPPCRVLDTRNPAGSPPFTGQINSNVLASGCGGTNQAQAFVFNATVVPSASLGYLSLGYLTLWAQGSSQPLASTENSLDGAITSNMAIVPTSLSGISAFATDSTYLILDTSGYFAP